MLTIDADLVSHLVADQHPRWARLPVRPVSHEGWDNRTFRLGDELAVRLPSAEDYVAGVEKEERVLRGLVGRLPVAVPESVAVGRPGQGYPFPWSVRRWLDGETVDRVPGLERLQLARDLGATLRALRDLPADGGPLAGQHSFYRGAHPSAYGDQVQAALGEVDASIDVDRAWSVWSRATTSVWRGAPVWFHGDVAVGNLLVRDGALSAIIDFGTCGVGDPACDLVMAWTFFRDGERAVFRDAVGLDDDTWDRARGWALWKALISVVDRPPEEVDPVQSAALAEVLSDDGR
jgi:aminoglycoside phosphotransferase (APT) family kinase protein